jgi:hypothetical protein
VVRASEAPVKTGMEQEMEVLYGEDPASHTGPESWGCVREGVRQALTGESAGRVSSLENAVFGSADVVDVSGRQHRHVRYGEHVPGSPWSKTSSMRRSFIRGNREAPCLPDGDGSSGRAGNSEEVIQR